MFDIAAVAAVELCFSCMMCDSPVDLKEAAGWPGKGLKSRQIVLDKLQGTISYSLCGQTKLFYSLTLCTVSASDTVIRVSEMLKPRYTS